MIASAASTPDFVNYLTYIFASTQLNQFGLSGASLFSTRYSAAVSLKNFIKNSFRSIQPQTLSYVKTSVLGVLQDSNPQLRSFAGTVITEIVQQGGLLKWPELLGDLL